MEGTEIGKGKNTDDPPTVVLKLFACDSSPVVSVFHQVCLVVLDVGEPCV